MLYMKVKDKTTQADTFHIYAVCLLVFPLLCFLKTLHSLQQHGAGNLNPHGSEKIT